MNFQEYIMPELLILIPVLYLIGMAIKASSINDKFIPWILGVVSIALCVLWVFSHSDTTTSSAIMTLIFTSITQGVLIAGASVYANQLYKQATKEE